MVRSAVLQIHTAIEDILDQLTFTITGGTFRRVRGYSACALRTILFGTGNIGFDKKLALALALRIITRKTKDRLQILNTLRNRCSHNWLLKVPVRYGKRPAEKAPAASVRRPRSSHRRRPERLH